MVFTYFERGLVYTVALRRVEFNYLKFVLIRLLMRHNSSFDSNVAEKENSHKRFASTLFSLVISFYRIYNFE